MRRLLPLLLLATPALCWAVDSEADASKKGACVYARPATTASAGEADAPQARPATPPAARSTPKPATSIGGGGGGEVDAVMPRARGNRWHSFLPGMFR